MGTVLLRDGTIIDGTGKPAFPGHVLIEGEAIKEVLSPGADAPGTDEIIDARGCVVCPGFIDMHSHSDWLLALEENPELLRCFIEQGITTVVAGNCGFSPAPVREEALVKLQQLLALFERPPEFTWQTMAGFLSRLEEIGPSLNIAELAGHAVIRLAAADTLRGRMKPGELKNCLDALRQSLEEGACGLSFGLGYEPGMYSPLDEIEAFSRVAREKNLVSFDVNADAIRRVTRERYQTHYFVAQMETHFFGEGEVGQTQFDFGEFGCLLFCFREILFA